MNQATLIWQLYDSDAIPSDSEQINVNRRLYPRFFLPEDGQYTIKLEGGHTGVIKDISYGGISVTFSNDKFFASIADLLYGQLPVTVELTVLGKSVQCNMIAVFREGNNVGLCFRHDSSEELVFLKNIINSLSIGTDLGALPMVHPRSTNTAVHSGENLDSQLMGEVCLERNISGGLNVHVTFKDGNIHYSVHFDHGNYTTLQTIGMGGVLAPLTPTVRVDKRIIRGATFLLAGLLVQTGDAEVKEAYQQFCQQALGQKLTLKKAS
jgi:hypothetical protein